MAAMVRAAERYIVRPGSVAGVFERFTDRARRVLVLAQDEAGLLGHNFIGTEHLLLGLIHEGDGIAAKALQSLGVELDTVRAAVKETAGPAGDSGAGSSPAFTPRAKKVLELSLREALGLGHNYIGTEHMLLAITREGKGVAAQVLVRAGGGVEQVGERTLEQVRERTLQLLRGYVAPEPTGETAAILGPRCQHCRAGLAHGARSRRLLVPDDDGGPPADTTVVYCGFCGRGIGAHVEPGVAPPD